MKHSFGTVNRSIFYTVAVQVPNVALGFLTGICITRLLEEAGRGQYALLNADLVLLALVMTMGLGQGLVYYLAKGEVAAREIIGIAATWALCMGVGLGLVVIWAWFAGMPPNPLFPAGLNEAVPVTFVCAMVFLSVTGSLFTAVFQGLRLFRAVNQVTLFSALVLFVSFGLVYLLRRQQAGPANLHWALCAAFVGALLVDLAWLRQYLAHIRARPVLFTGGAWLRPLLSLSMLGYGANLINQLNYRLDIWFVEGYRGAEELGLYAVAVGVAQFFFLVPDPIAQVLQPTLIHRDDLGVLDKFRLFARLNFTLVLIGGAVLSLLAGWFFPFVYGKGFQPSATAFRILMPGILFACTSKMMVLCVIRSGKLGYNILASGIGLVFTIALNLLLVPRYGLNGAALASTVAYGVVMLVVMAVVFLRFKLPLGNYFLLTPSDIFALWRQGRAGLLR